VVVDVVALYEESANIARWLIMSARYSSAFELLILSGTFAGVMQCNVMLLSHGPVFSYWRRNVLLCYLALDFVSYGSYCRCLQINSI